MLINLPRGLHTNRVFLSKGKPVKNFAGNYKLQWSRAVQEVKLGDFTFQDLRHCAINNLRIRGNDHFTIMAISGQKTPSVFQRYNVVTEEELQGVKWKTEESRGVHIGVHQCKSKWSLTPQILGLVCLSRQKRQCLCLTSRESQSTLYSLASSSALDESIPYPY